MKSEDLVSICVPTFNGERHIARTIKSALSQTYSRIEVLVSDGGSTDKTISIVNSFGDSNIRVLENDSALGPEENWNRAVTASNGKFVKLLCQDDLIDADCIQRQVEALQSVPTATFCWSPRRVISNSGRIRFPVKESAELPKVAYLEDWVGAVVRSGTNPFGEPCATLFRREAYDLTLGFRGNYLIDLDMWLQLWALGPAVSTIDTLASFRLNRGSWSRRIGNGQAEDWVGVLHAFQLSLGLEPEDFRVGTRRAFRLTKLRKIIAFLGSYS